MSITSILYLVNSIEYPLRLYRTMRITLPVLSRCSTRDDNYDEAEDRQQQR